ncbi:MAG: hypothetical protein V4670_10825 [Bacteroidota bacterium]
MLKNILNLEGAQQLSNNEQKAINGGKQFCEATTDYSCPPGYCCKAIGSYCVKNDGSQGLCSAPLMEL